MARMRRSRRAREVLAEGIRVTETDNGTWDEITEVYRDTYRRHASELLDHLKRHGLMVVDQPTKETTDA